MPETENLRHSFFPLFLLIPLFFFSLLINVYAIYEICCFIIRHIMRVFRKIRCGVIKCCHYFFLLSLLILFPSSTPGSGCP